MSFELDEDGSENTPNLLSCFRLHIKQLFLSPPNGKEIKLNKNRIRMKLKAVVYSLFAPQKLIMYRTMYA